MKNLFVLLSFTLAVVFSLCSCQQSQTPQAAETPAAQKAANADEQTIMALLYQQRAAEYRALCLQAYNIARYRLDEALKKKSKLPLAVITDLDETALDNSASSVWAYQHDIMIDNNFLRPWWVKGIADSVPGSVSFFSYAHGKGVDVYYISNRDASDSALRGTMKNMRSLGFPFTSDADTGHFLFRTTTSSKEGRRHQVAASHNIVLLLGDNLSDADSSFDSKPADVRIKEVDRLRQHWGERYIVFPNATYGDWEFTLYSEYSKAHPGVQLSRQTKDSIRLANLHAAY
jgi:5'-nucleotidase (lipoprotein e(P4) family)